MEADGFLEEIDMTGGHWRIRRIGIETASLPGPVRRCKKIVCISNYTSTRGIDSAAGWENGLAAIGTQCGSVRPVLRATKMAVPTSARTLRAAPVSPTVLIRGAGEMASAVAWRLYMANIRRICMTELDAPLCVRRTVSFCTAIEEGNAHVEGVVGCAVHSPADLETAWQNGKIAVVSRRHWHSLANLAPDIVIDAILAKQNVATTMADAGLVIALGPGFVAGRDCHIVIETNRGHDLGRVITQGAAEPNTGIPGDIAGHTEARVLRSPADGIFQSERHIGDRIKSGGIVGQVGGVSVVAGIDGILRGLIVPGTPVTAGLKLGDIDPRARPDHCHTISDKARAIAGAVLEAVMRHCNKPHDG
jgi:xanthine dehydrogenase accessory factor